MWRFVIDIPVTECGKRGEIKQELRTEIKKKKGGGFLRTSRGAVKRFSGQKVIPAQIKFGEEAEPDCGGGYHT